MNRALLQAESKWLWNKWGVWHLGSEKCMFCLKSKTVKVAGSLTRRQSNNQAICSNLQQFITNHLNKRTSHLKDRISPPAAFWWNFNDISQIFHRMLLKEIRYPSRQIQSESQCHWNKLLLISAYCRLCNYRI